MALGTTVPYAGRAPRPHEACEACAACIGLECPTCLRHPCVAWAAASLRPACWAQGYAPPQRAQGTAPQAAVRALAGQGIRLLVRGGQDRPPYQESVSLKALHRPGASLIHHLAQGS